MEERAVILERIAKRLAAIDLKTLAAVERIISTYINAVMRREVR
jgi:hypothetical protein